MERRAFIKDCGIMCLGAAGVTSLLQSCKSANYYAQTNSVKNIISVKKTEFTLVKKGKAEQRKYVLVKLINSEFPVALYKHNETEYSALLLYCTHKGCELQPHGEYLVCPCHGSEFNNKGKVLNPPAELDLQQFKTRVDGENILIETT